MRCDGIHVEMVLASNCALFRGLRWLTSGLSLEHSSWHVDTVGTMDFLMLAYCAIYLRHVVFHEAKDGGVKEVNSSDLQLQAWSGPPRLGT
jgi:hypothetical protein